MMVELKKNFARSQENAQDGLNDNFFAIEAALNNTPDVDKVATKNIALQSGVNLIVQRIGKLVIATLPRTTFGAPAGDDVAISGVTIPIGFRPINTVPLNIVRAGTTTASGYNYPIVLTFKTDGSITWTNWTGTGFPHQGSVVWITNDAWPV